MLGVRLSKDLEQRLVNLSQRTGRTQSYYVKQALQTFLDDREDYLLGLAALERKEPTISLEELEKKLGLENKNH
jgi:RHH-type rel operon transcriptional repressor/antitoxin RelB